MRSIKLRVVGGETESAEIELILPALVGRGREVAVNLASPLVSRRHCELYAANGWVVVRDLESLNGTFVGSERVVEAILRPGALLTIGTVTFRAHYEVAEDGVPDDVRPSAGSGLADTARVNGPAGDSPTTHALRGRPKRDVIRSPGTPRHSPGTPKRRGTIDPSGTTTEPQAEHAERNGVPPIRLPR